MLSKIILLVSVVPFLVQTALAHYQAALLCEHNTHWLMEHDQIIYPCYTGPYYTCSIDNAGSDWYFPGSRWDGFISSKMRHIYCDGMYHHIALCYKWGGRYWRSETARCPDGHEVVTLVVSDTQRRRLRGENSPDVEEQTEEEEKDQESEKEEEEDHESYKEVEIDGETVTIVLA